MIQGSKINWNIVPLGITRDELIKLLGNPDDIGGTSRKYKTPIIYKYGYIEYCFTNGKDGILCMIFDSLNHITLRKD